MSIEAMSKVWEFSNHKESELLMLLAIANRCNEYGMGATYTMAELAQRVRCSKRNAYYILDKLIESGEVVHIPYEGVTIHSDRTRHKRRGSVFHIVYQDGSNAFAVETYLRSRNFGMKSASPENLGCNPLHPKIENEMQPTSPQNKKPSVNRDSKSNEISDLQRHENCNYIKRNIKKNIKSNIISKHLSNNTSLTNSENSLQGQGSEESLSVDELSELFLNDGFTSESESLANDFGNAEPVLTDQNKAVKLESEIKGQPNLFNKKLPAEKKAGVKISKTIQTSFVELCYGITDPKQWSILTGKQFGQISHAVSAMEKAGADFSKLTHFKEWWKKNYRSRNGDGSYKFPLPNQVRELWFEAMGVQAEVRVQSKPETPAIDNDKLETIARSLASKNRGK